MPAILHSAAEKRALLRRWATTAISLKEAHERDLVRYSRRVIWRNWTTREELYEFALESAQASPVLVRVDDKRMALFTPRRK
jgi:hypothetical protein